MIRQSSAKTVCWTMALALVMGCSMPLAAQATDPNSVTVFAAASTTNAINDICKLFTEKGKGTSRSVLCLVFYSC